MFARRKPKIEITPGEYKALKSLEENAKRQSKNRAEFAVSADELLEDYNRWFPPNLWQKMRKESSINVNILESHLISLSEKGLASKEVRNYSDQALKKETRFFKLTEEGRLHLYRKN